MTNNFRGREENLRRDSGHFFADESDGTLPEGIQHDFESSDAARHVQIGNWTHLKVLSFSYFVLNKQGTWGKEYLGSNPGAGN